MLMWNPPDFSDLPDLRVAPAEQRLRDRERDLHLAAREEAGRRALLTADRAIARLAELTTILKQHTMLPDDATVLAGKLTVIRASVDLAGVL
jgi:hypothetical protein